MKTFKRGCVRATPLLGAASALQQTAEVPAQPRERLRIQISRFTAAVVIDTVFEELMRQIDNMADWGKTHDIAIAEAPKEGRRASKPIYGTSLGAAYCGDSLKVLKSKALRVECPH